MYSLPSSHFDIFLEPEAVLHLSILTFPYVFKPSFSTKTHIPAIQHTLVYPDLKSKHSVVLYKLCSTPTLPQRSFWKILAGLPPTHFPSCLFFEILYQRIIINATKDSFPSL